jgi:endonuclease-8
VPEGDTVFRTARTLHRALAGAQVTAFDTRLPQLLSLPVRGGLPGRQVSTVEARGKHILMAFGQDLILRTHLRMHGSWHLARPGERWRRPRAHMRIVITTADWLAIGFEIPEAEWLTAGSLARHVVLQSLGPDPLSPSFDAHEVTARIASHPAAAMADVLLNQRVIAGLGNVFKSEVLFECRVSPFDRVRDLEPEAIAAVVAASARALRKNVIESSSRPGGRRTMTNRLNRDETLWVYRRAGRPCHRCGAEIQTRKTGPDARSTYWCPSCQPSRSSVFS